MPSVATGWLNSLESTASTVTGIVNQLGGLAGGVAQIYSAFKGGGGGGGGGGRAGRATALPGGAPIGGNYTLAGGFMPTLPTSPTAIQAGVGTDLMNRGIDYLQGQSNSGAIVARQVPGHLVLPHTVNVPNPNDPSKIETYVRAPRVKYKVTVSRYRRRCRGGR